MRWRAEVAAQRAAAATTLQPGARRAPSTFCVRVARMMISVRSGVTRTSTLSGGRAGEERFPRVLRSTAREASAGSSRQEPARETAATARRALRSSTQSSAASMIPQALLRLLQLQRPLLLQLLRTRSSRPPPALV